MTTDEARSFYLFDIDDNLFFLPTLLYLWNAETMQEQAVGSGTFATIQGQLGRAGAWQAWAVREETFRDFRDRPGLSPAEQPFVREVLTAAAGADGWQGPSWRLLEHAAVHGRPIAMVTARGHAPSTIEAALQALVGAGRLPALPPILGLYTVTNEEVRRQLGATDPGMTVPSVKKLAIKHAVEIALERYGDAPPHRFGMSDDDPANVVLAVSAMRDCKLRHPDKRFFVINTNRDEFVKLEVFPMEHPATAARHGAGVLDDGRTMPMRQTVPDASLTAGGTASVYVSDMDRAIAFYTERLGLALRTRVGSDWAELDAGEGLILGLHPARPPATARAGAVGAVNIELRVREPLERVRARLADRGVEFDSEIQSYPAVRLATVRDPDGNPVILAEVLDPGPPPPPT